MRFARECCAPVMMALLAFPVTVLAHHSMAEFDRTVTLELEGELVDVSWTNPHVLLWMSASGSNTP